MKWGTFEIDGFTLCVVAFFVCGAIASCCS
jgi:hypothetical protein